VFPEDQLTVVRNNRAFWVEQTTGEAAPPAGSDLVTITPATSTSGKVEALRFQIGHFKGIIKLGVDLD